MNRRAVLYSAGAVAAAAIVGLLALTTAPPPGPTEPARAVETTAKSTSVATATTTTTVSTAVITKPSASAAPSSSGSEDELDPEHDDSWQLLAGNAEPGEGDPFEDTGAGEPMGKLLGKVGAIRYGVLREKTTVTNETEVAAILRRGAHEIDKLDRDRKDQPHKRMPEYEAILKKLRDELRPHMSGSVMVAGQGWALATAVNESSSGATHDGN